MPNLIIRAWRIELPEGVTFADLKLERDPVTLDISFDLRVVERVLRHNGIDPAAVLADEDAVSALLHGWYRMHRANGGAPDHVHEQILAEVAAEDAHGLASVISHAGTHKH